MKIPRSDKPNNSDGLSSKMAFKSFHRKRNR
jgi:hypothetical protein